MKKLFTLFCAFMAGMAITRAEVYSGTCGAQGDNITWSLNSEDSVLTISGTGEMDDYTIYESSYSPWLKLYSNVIKQVIITDGITHIGKYAFVGCEKVQSVEMANSVTSIGEGAFWNCTNASSINLSNSLVNIGKQAFWQCNSLLSIEIPNSVTSIGENAFNYCHSLTDLTIGNGLQYIDEHLFFDCKNLENININKDNTFYDSRNDCNAIIETSTNRLIQGAGNTTIPNDIICIRNNAFANNLKLKEIIIPSSVTQIENNPFSRCDSLSKIIVDQNNPIYDSRNSSNAIIQTNSNKLITGCKNTIIPYNIQCIGPSAFNGAFYLDTLILPESVTTIESGAFVDCKNLIKIDLPKGLTTIGINAFASCSKIENVIIPPLTTRIEIGTFQNCINLTNIFIPNGVIRIDEGAFTGCKKLSNIEFPNSITYIGKYAFAWCKSLTDIVIPLGTTSIDDKAFYDCTNLTSITCEAPKTPTLGMDVFYNVDKSIPLYVPAQSIDAYKSAEGWKDFTNILPIEGSSEEPCIIAFGTCGSEGDGTNLTWELTCDSVLTISGSGAMKNYENNASAPWNVYAIKSITIGDNVTNIGNWAFHGNGSRALKHVSLSNSITSIGEGAFRDCRELTSINIPNSVIKIEGQAFLGCNNLTNLTIPYSVKNIALSSFSGCNNLTNIIVDDANIIYDSRNNCNAIIETATNTLIRGCRNTIIPNSVTNIGEAFSGCIGLSNIDIPNGVINIGAYAFSSCEDLLSINIPNSVASIGNNSFAFCPNLSSIIVEEGNSNYDCRDNCNAIIVSSKNTLLLGCKNTIIPNNITNIGEYAFRGSGLTNISIPNSVISIGDGAFEACKSLTSVIMSNNVTNIGNQAFYSCKKLTNIYLPNSLTHIERGAFIDCQSLVRVTIPNKLTNIEEGTFSGCTSLDSVYIPNSVTNIGKWAFNGCKALKGLLIPESVTNIGDYAFASCASLTSIKIPNNVTSIGEWVFAWCKGISSVTNPSETPNIISANVFTDVDKSIPLYVPAQSIDAYKSAEGWKDFANILPIPGTEISCQPYVLPYDTTIYQEDKMIWRNKIISTNTIGEFHYYDSLVSMDGCDSVIVLNLIVKPKTEKLCSWLAESNDIEKGVVLTNFNEPFYKYGAQIMVEASPNSGYKFVKWNDGKKYNPYKFTILEDKYLLAIFMEEQEEQDTTTVQPSATSATFTWPFIVGGFSYSLTIYLDVLCTIPFCTISFNQYGQFVGISFAKKSPRRTVEQESSFTYTISNLDANTAYYFKMETLDEQNKLLNTDEGSFTTTDTATALDQIESSSLQGGDRGRLIIKDGQIFILRRDKTYTVTGAEVK